MPEAHWLASLGEEMSYRFRKRPCLGSKGGERSGSRSDVDLWLPHARIHMASYQHACAPTHKNTHPTPTPSNLKVKVLFCPLGRKVCFPHSLSEGWGNPTVKVLPVFSCVCTETLPAPSTLPPSLCGNVHRVLSRTVNSCQGQAFLTEDASRSSVPLCHLSD